MIVGIIVEDRAETVYNFEVNETHTYLVVVSINPSHATFSIGEYRAVHEHAKRRSTVDQAPF